MLKKTNWLSLLATVSAVAVGHGFFINAVAAQPSLKTAPSEPASTTTTVGSSSNGTAPTTATSAVSATNAPADAQAANTPPKRICRTSPQTGTRLRALRICRTEAEWRQSATETQKSVRVMQGRGGVPTVN